MVHIYEFNNGVSTELPYIREIHDEIWTKQTIQVQSGYDIALERSVTKPKYTEATGGSNHF
jgi:hypothetical protein